MKVILVVASFNLTSPYRGTAYRPSFAEKQISRSEGESFLVGLGEVHFVEVRKIEATPIDVSGSEERPLIIPGSVLL